MALLFAGFPTSAMVNLEPVEITGGIPLELLGQGEQSVYVIPETGNGFRRGEKLTWTAATGMLGCVSYDGQAVIDPWVILPGETGVIRSVYQDRTNIYGRDVIVVTSAGNIWRIDGAGNAEPAAALSDDLSGVVTLSDNPEQYGEWSGKILAGGGHVRDDRTIAYNYGSRNGRLESIIATTAGQYAYGYDTAGRISSITAPGNETLTFSYNGPLQLQEKWQGVINGQVDWEYDNNFWPIAQSVNNGETIYYGYDDDGLLTEAGELSLSRNAQNGLLTRTTLGNVTDDWAYNGFGKTTNYTASINGIPVFDVEYTRDKLGRITEKLETANGTRYEYDEAGRFTDVERNGVVTAHYEYDANGNRTLAQVAGVSYAGTYDEQDRLLSYGSTTYTYTANGELLTKTDMSGTTSYVYDEFGNLRLATLPGGTEIEYVIDGSDRRIGKKVNGALGQGFLYDGQLQIVAELDGAGEIASRFVYGDRANIPSYMITGGEAYRIIADHLGSPRLVINATDGSIVQRMDYDEFGNVLNDTNPGFQPFGFAGGLYDRDTGLVRFGARDYDPHTGRWTTKDPIRFNAGGTNFYIYVENDPTNYIDPSGLAQIGWRPLASKPGNYAKGAWPLRHEQIWYDDGSNSGYFGIVRDDYDPKDKVGHIREEYKFYDEIYDDRLIETNVDVSQENTQYFSYKNKYSGGHLIILQMSNLSSHDASSFHHRELRSPLKLRIAFYIDDNELDSISFDYDFEDNFHGTTWAGEGKSGLLLGGYMCPKHLLLNKSITCKLEVIVPDPELEIKYGPMTIFIEKISDLH